MAVHPVSGEVYLNGEPAAGVTATFHPKEHAQAESTPLDHPRGYGNVEESGKLKITTYDVGDGLAAGEYIVTFEWAPPRIGGFNLGGDPGGSRRDPDKLGGKYSDPTTSEVTFTVTPEGPNDLGRIDLEADLEAIAEENEAETNRLAPPDVLEKVAPPE